MIPGNAELVICPFCGTKKELMTLVSGNTFGAEYWSDNKRIAPMLPMVSPVQKCPHCGKYYLKSKQKSVKGDSYSGERGELTFPEWKEAYDQFQRANAFPTLYPHTKITDDDFIDIRYWLFQAYNDYFYRGKQAEPSQEDYAFFCRVVKDFIDVFDWSPIEAPLLKAELYREANEMEKCADVLAAISYDKLKDFEKGIYDGIKDRMEKNDPVVFRLNL